MTEWKECTIADLGMVVGGATPSTKDPENYDGGMIPWITPKDLSNYSDRYISRGERNITEKGLNGCSTQLMPRHSVLFTSRAPIGYIAIADNEVCTNQGFKSVVPNEQTDYLFLYYLLKFNKEKIEGLGSGTTFKEVSGSTMRGITVNVPKLLDDQRAIGRYLNSIDTKIETNRRINENVQQQAFALFEQLLSQSEGDLCMLSEIAELNPKRQLAKGVVARYIDMAQLSTAGTFPNGWEMKPYNGGMRFSNGDTIIARITPCLENGKTAFIDFLDNYEVAFGSTEYIVLSSKGIYPAEYFYCLARYPSFIDYAVKNMNGSSGRQRVSADTLGKYLLPQISKEEICLFRDTVTPFFKAMRNNSLENMRLSVLRDTLLPKLMSGELDVSELDL